MLVTVLGVSESVLTKWTKPEERMVSASSRDASTSGVLKETVKMESRPCSKSSTACSKKG